MDSKRAFGNFFDTEPSADGGGESSTAINCSIELMISDFNNKKRYFDCCEMV
jgi:hypothetical protein